MTPQAEITNGFVFFWGDAPPNGVFSNWYLSNFTHDGVRYNCAEQYMMRMKAVMFNDHEVEKLIMENKKPRLQKALGREVRGFNRAKWLQHCEGIMVPALVSKFTQDEFCKEILLSTGDAILVEASPVDEIWGIGLAADDPDAQIRGRWRGLNLLGKVLMRARDIIVNG